MTARIGRKGFTLIEITITTIIAAIVIIGLGYIVLTTQRYWIKGGREADLQRDITLSMYWMKRVLRDGEKVNIADGGGSIEVENVSQGWKKKFYRQGNNLIMETGGKTEVIVDDLTNLSFSWGVRDIGINLTLSKYNRQLTTSSAVTLRNKPLAAEWLFDKGSGTTVEDTSPNGNEGTISGATWTGGVHGSALSFDGVNDYVRVSSDYTLNLTEGINVGAWVNLQATGNRQSLVEKIAPGQSGYWLAVGTDGRLSVELGTANGFYREMSTNSINWNKWQAVGFSYDGSQLKFYINGKLDPRVVAVTGKIVSNNQDLYLGTYHAGGDWVRGKIDEVRISD
jgi:prepilin-type N-terminal cleavage/methylation domain-containing protein